MTIADRAVLVTGANRGIKALERRYAALVAAAPVT
jgi:NAD(P)-dependent dehydrogenase (short-subunit alcohol dehydrogenase family)